MVEENTRAGAKEGRDMDVRLIFGIILTLLLPFFAEVVLRFFPKIMEGQSLVARLARRFHKYFPHLILMSIMVLAIVIETQFDPWLTAAIGWDFTPWVYSVEGDLVEVIQTTMWHPVLTQYFVFTYTVLYGFLFYAFVVLYIKDDNEEMVKTLVMCHILTYLFAIPFYLLFPVNEVWTTNIIYSDYQYGHVIGGLHAGQPGTEVISTTINSINNCFPSLHVSISLTVFFILATKRQKLYATIAFPISLSVVISTIYLGVHWVIDVLAGYALATIVTYMAYHITYDIEYPLKITNVRWKGRRMFMLLRKRKGWK